MQSPFFNKKKTTEKQLTKIISTYQQQDKMTQDWNKMQIQQAYSKKKKKTQKTLTIQKIILHCSFQTQIYKILLRK